MTIRKTKQMKTKTKQELKDRIKELEEENRQLKNTYHDLTGNEWDSTKV